MDAINKPKIGIIILAAGASTRLGRPKQLLQFQGKTLIERIIETALETGFQTVVVLGANAEKIVSVLEGLPIKIIINKNWESGMSYSIVTGLRKLIEINLDLSAVIFLLCDQPFITKDTILKLIEKQKETEKRIVTSEYGKTFGVPTLFTKDLFAELLDLKGDVGARFLIKKYEGENLARIAVPEAGFDIDTEEDFDRLIRS